MVYYTGSNNLPKPIDDNFHGQNSWPLNYNQGLYTGDTTGFGASGDCSISAVTPYEKGFETPYWSQNQRNSYNNWVNSRANASANAYFLTDNQYNRGPWSNRGGLADGWGAVNGGKILKISKTGSSSSWTSGCSIAARGDVKSYKHQVARFRSYVWISSGMGSSSKSLRIGIMDSQSSFAVDNLDDWTYIDHVFSTSDVTNPNFLLNLGMDSGGNTREVYLAYPTTHMVFNSSIGYSGKGLGDTFTDMTDAGFISVLQNNDHSH